MPFTASIEPGRVNAVGPQRLFMRAAILRRERARPREEERANKKIGKIGKVRAGARGVEGLGVGK